MAMTSFGRCACRLDAAESELAKAGASQAEVETWSLRQSERVRDRASVRDRESERERVRERGLRVLARVRASETHCESVRCRVRGRESVSQRQS
eukprot:517641-Rhodomonas_salina.1